MHTTTILLRALLIALLLTSWVVPIARADHPHALVFLHYWTGALNGGIDDMIRAFNETSPERKVHATGFEHESFKVGINVMLSSGSPPDMFSYWAGAKVQALVDKGLIAPIDGVWKQAKLDSVFPPAVGKACTYSGHKYALPLTQHYVAFFYNKQLFSEHGITPPADWKSFLTACETLKQAGVTPIALGSRERWPAQFWFDYILLRTAGPAYRQRLMQGKADYDDPEVEQTFARWKSLLDAGYFNDDPNLLDWSEAAKLVHSGQAAMTLMGTWAIGLFDGQLGWTQEQEYDFFSFPTMRPEVPTTALGPIDVIVVPRQGETESVNSVLAYFSAPGPQMEMSRGSGALSPSQTVSPKFYTPLQRRILKDIRRASHWAFNYDLATPPLMAEHGLDGFREFIANPAFYKQILNDLDYKARQFRNKD